MENKNMTAVEWLEQKVKEFAIDLDLLHYFEQAKKMEKEQSFVHFKAGQDSMEEEGKSFDQYYSETFNK